jgi:hypothetical protein
MPIARSPKRASSPRRSAATNRKRETVSGAGAWLVRIVQPRRATRGRRFDAALAGGRQAMYGSDPELDALEGGEGELWGEMPGELGMPGETFEAGEGFEAGEAYESAESQRVFDEVDEMELAGSLLEVASEEELDRFLGDLLRRAGRAVGSVVRSPIGRSLVDILKNAAGQALPGIGGLMDAAVGGTGGGALGEMPSEAGQLFGMELEGLSQEDQEYEVARRFVRFGGAAAANAAQAPPAMPPQAAAGNAAAAAARDHAPGLLGPRGRGRSGPGRRHARHGRWIRRGRTIVIVNCGSPAPSAPS